MNHSVNSTVTQSRPMSIESVDIPLTLHGAAPTSTASVPVCGGLCLPKGRLTDAAESYIITGDSHLPAQADVLSRWSDGSIRWLLASWIAPPTVQNGPCTLQLTPAASSQTSAADSESRIQLLRRDRQFVIQHSETTPARTRLIEFEVSPRLTLSDGRDGEFTFGDVQTLTEGSVRSVYSVDGVLKSDHHVSLRLKFEVWPAAGLVQVRTRIRNSRRARHKGGLWDLGDPGSLLFAGLYLDTQLTSPCQPSIRWQAEPVSDVRQLASDQPLQVLQTGSGGPAWSCTNHVGSDGQSTVSDRGYVASSGDGTVRGYRSQPVVSLTTEDAQLSVCMPDFWQMFPSSVESNGNTVRAGLFPMIEGLVHELQGGEQSTQSFWLSTAPVDANLSQLATAGEPLRMVQPADWVKQAQVFDWFAGSVDTTAETTADDASHRYLHWLQDVTSGEHSLTARRESIDEYGWRNYGDIPADHEQTHYSGSNTIISHYNNQFDLIYGGILNMMVSGDPRWHELFAPMARHVMDIDIYHTTEDRAGFNGGLFWHTDHYVDARTATHRTYSRFNCPEGGDYGGGPSNEHNYATGLVYYYYLTGDPEAIDAVRSLGDWVLGLDDGSATVFGLLDDGPSGDASTTVQDTYHGPGRGSGNSISVLLDAWELTKDDRYLNKAEELIRRVVHPQQDIAQLDLLDAEYRWSYTVCLTSLGRYLAKMSEADRRGPMYDYVRRTLCHYGRWMVENERPTLSHPEGLEYVTEAWAAQEFRKANVLRIAASCCDDADLSQQMRQRADELNDAAWHDLYQFGDRHLTARCFSIVMTEGLRDVFHRTHRDHHTQPAEKAATPDEWTMFVPQRTRVRQMLKSPRRLLEALPQALNPARWLRTLDALRRRLG